MANDVEKAAAETNENATGSDDDQDLYEVQDILDVRLGVDRRFEYRVRWEGYASNDDTWEPVVNIMGEGARAILDRFKEKHKERMLKLRGIHPEKAAKNDIPKKRLICADDISTEDHRVDMKLLGKELESDDEFYDERVSELSGEKKRLVDRSKKISSSEVLLHSLGSRDRVTRTGLRMLSGADAGISDADDKKKITRNIPAKSNQKVPGTTAQKRRSSTKSSGAQVKEEKSVAEGRVEKKKAKKRAVVLSSSDSEEESIQIQPRLNSQRRSFPKLANDLATGRDLDEELKMMYVQSPTRDEDDDYLLPDAPLYENLDWNWEMQLSYKVDDEYSHKAASGGESFMTVLQRGISEDFSAMMNRMDHEEFMRNVRVVGEDGKNCLHVLATTSCDDYHGVDDILAMILKATGRELLVQVDSHRKTPLHYAISSGYACHVKTFTNQLAPLDVCDSFNQTPLQAAYGTDSPAILRAILRAGGNFHELFNCKHLPSEEMKEELAVHATTVTALLKAYRGWIFGNGEVEMGVASTVYVSPIQDGPLFVINTARTRREIADDQRMVLVVYVCSFHGPPKNWTARCWGGLQMKDAPQLNGEEMKLAFTCDDLPVAFECPMVEGNNEISLHLQEDPLLSGLILAAQVVIVSRQNNNNNNYQENP